MIDFEAPKPIQMLDTALETVAVNMMRPKSRYFDEHEHEIPWDYINFMHMAMRQTGVGSLAPTEKKKVDSEGKPRPSDRLSISLHLCSSGFPGGMLGCICAPRGADWVRRRSNRRVLQSRRRSFWSDLKVKKPIFGAMAMTEPQAGSRFGSDPVDSRARQRDELMGAEWREDIRNRWAKIPHR